MHPFIEIRASNPATGVSPGNAAAMAVGAIAAAVLTAIELDSLAELAQSPFAVPALWLHAFYLVVLGLPVLSFVAVRRLLPSVPAPISALYAAGLSIVLLLVLGDQWMGPYAHALANARPALLTIVLAGAVASFAGDHLGGWIRRAAMVLTMCVVTVVALRAVYAMANGAALTAGLVFYAARNLVGVIPIVATEATPSRLFALAVPAVAIPLFLIARSRRRVNAVRRVNAGWPLLVCGLVVLVVPGGRNGPYSAMMLVTEAWSQPSACEVRLVESVPAPAPARAVLAATDSARTLNVVLIYLESIGAGVVASGDATQSLTPFLSSLRSRGLWVESLHPTVNHTNKALGPALTGSYHYPQMTYLERTGVPSPGLPVLLRPHGYRSAFFTPATLSFERKDQILHTLGFDAARGREAISSEGFASTGYFGPEDRALLEPVLEWVDGQKRRGGPFLLSLLTLTSHHPYNLPGAALSEGDGEGRRAEYEATVRYTDGFLRDLMRGFSERGMLDSTVFIIIGDHGEAFGEHGLWFHSHVPYDEVLHVPGVILAPGLQPGVIEGPRSTMDILPTVADLLNLDLRGSIPGRSLFAPPDSTRTLYHSAWDGSQALALRRGRMKYIWRPEAPMEVYDLATDPREMRSLASQTHPDTLAAVTAELLAWRARTEASWRAAACD